MTAAFDEVRFLDFETPPQADSFDLYAPCSCKYLHNSTHAIKAAERSRLAGLSLLKVRRYSLKWRQANWLVLTVSSSFHSFNHDFKRKRVCHGCEIGNVLAPLGGHPPTFLAGLPLRLSGFIGVTARALYVSSARRAVAVLLCRILAPGLACIWNSQYQAFSRSDSFPHRSGENGRRQMQFTGRAQESSSRRAGLAHQLKARHWYSPPNQICVYPATP